MRGEWRNYSDEQWMRLAQLGSVPSGSPRLFADSRQLLKFVTPLAIVAVFLVAPASDVPSWRRLDPQREDRTMNRMAIGLVVAAASTSMTQAQNLLVNGGLEGPSGSCTQLFISAGSSAIPGWTVSGSWPIDWIRNAAPAVSDCYCPAEGSYAVDLNGSPNTVSGSAIRQVAVTSPGGRYRLTWKALSNPYATPAGTVKTLRVTTGSTVSEFALATGEPLTQCSVGWPWDFKSVSFTATDTTTAIELRSTFPNSGGGIFIDDIALTLEPCSGDIDLSGSINGIDLAIVLQNWGAPSAEYPRSDINGDGVVNGSDLALVLSNWGACP